MMKYILKESELKAMLTPIIKEELDSYLKGNVNEGLLGAIGRGVGNLALNSLLGIVAPAHLAKRVMSKKNNEKPTRTRLNNTSRRRRVTKNKGRKKDDE